MAKRYTDIVRKVLTSIDKQKGFIVEGFLEDKAERDILETFINLGVVDFNQHQGTLKISEFHKGNLERFWA